MAIFETDGSTEIRITPKEFYTACSLAEENALADIIMNEYDLVYNDDDKQHETPLRSISQREFNSNLASLKENWLTISMKDVEKIKKIAKKYGG